MWCRRKWTMTTLHSLSSTPHDVFEHRSLLSLDSLLGCCICCSTSISCPGTAGCFTRLAFFGFQTGSHTSRTRATAVDQKRIYNPTCWSWWNWDGSIKSCFSPVRKSSFLKIPNEGSSSSAPLKTFLDKLKSIQVQSSCVWFDTTRNMKLNYTSLLPDWFPLMTYLGKRRIDDVSVSNISLFFEHF